jgi:hypothetical protein
MKGFHRRGLTLGLSMLVTIAACFDFSVGIPTNIDNVQVSFMGTTSLDTVAAVDLNQNQDYVKHKDKISQLSLTSATITIPMGGIDSTNNVTTISSGSLAFRPDGATDASQDVQVGSIANLGIVTGASVTINGTAALDTFMLNVAKGSGKFQVVISGSVVPPSAGPDATVGSFRVNIALNLDLGVSVI